MCINIKSVYFRSLPHNAVLTTAYNISSRIGPGKDGQYSQQFIKLHLLHGALLHGVVAPIVCMYYRNNIYQFQNWLIKS